MKKIKWGVLGTAGIMNCTGYGMQKAEHCHLYAIAGRNPEKVKEFQEIYGFEKSYTSFDALLEDKEVEAVYIPLPNDLHYEWTKKALERKKHVLCEKPMAPTAKQAQELFAIAKENGVFLMEAFAYQHSPYMEALEEEIKSGVIGEVRYIETAFYITEREETDFRLRREAFGGCTYDVGVYGTSFVLRLLGQEPVKVKAVADFTEQHVDLLTNAQMEFADGKRATVSSGMMLEAGTNVRFDRFEIQGSKGAIHCQNFIYNGSGELRYEVVTFDGASQIKTVQVPDNYGLEVEQLSLCALGEAVPFVTEEFSIANARIVDKILEATGY